MMDEVDKLERENEDLRRQLRDTEARLREMAAELEEDDTPRRPPNPGRLLPRKEFEMAFELPSSSLVIVHAHCTEDESKTIGANVPEFARACGAEVE